MGYLGGFLVTLRQIGRRQRVTRQYVKDEGGKSDKPANVDETGMGKGKWLWVLVTAVATVFRIAAGRSRRALTDLIGTEYRRVLTSDRYPVYDHLPDWRHQLCWAHLRRDFQAMIDRKNTGSAVGAEL